MLFRSFQDSRASRKDEPRKQEYFTKEKLRDIENYMRVNYRPGLEAGLQSASKTTVPDYAAPSSDDCLRSGSKASMPDSKPSTDAFDNPPPLAQMRVCEAIYPCQLGNLLDNMDETFSEMLLRLIDEKGKKDTDVYKGANMDRKLFSKIRSNRAYNPKKTTVLALAISLELSLEETNELLRSAGYALSMGQKSDVIMQYFLERREYDLLLINETLLYFGQTLLGTGVK